MVPGAVKPLAVVTAEKPVLRRVRADVARILVGLGRVFAEKGRRVGYRLSVGCSSKGLAENGRRAAQPSVVVAIHRSKIRGKGL